MITTKTKEYIIETIDILLAQCVKYAGSKALEDYIEGKRDALEIIKGFVVRIPSESEE